MSAAPTVYQIAIGTVNPNSYTVPQQVRNGSKIVKLNIEVDFVDVAITVGTFDAYVWFNIGGTQARPVPGAANPAVIKNQIMHQIGCLTQLFQSTAVGIASPWMHKFRLEINVPRSLQQINENDTIEFVFQTSIAAATSSVKFRCIYKEIYP